MDEQYIRLQEEHEELKRKYDWLCYMPKWRRFLVYVFRVVRFGDWLWTTHEDTTCVVRCQCEEEVFINSEWITWCSNCSRGYSTLYEIIQYPSWLRRKNGD